MSNDVNNTGIPGINPAYANWTQQVVENLVEAEKKWIEFATEQNVQMLKSIQRGLELYNTAPNNELANWARQGLESFVESQKKWSETISQQTNQFLQGQSAAATQTAQTENQVSSAASTAVQQQVETLVEWRKRWLDFAAQQNGQFIKSLQENLRLNESQTPAKTFTDMAQQAVDNYVEVQKRWLDLYPNLFGRR